MVHARLSVMPVGHSDLGHLLQVQDELAEDRATVTVLLELWKKSQVK